MKYTEENLAEVISTEMFVRGVTREEYDDQIESIIESVDRANLSNYNAIQVCYKLHRGTQALLVIFGFTLETHKETNDEGYKGDIDIRWPNFKNKNYVFTV